MTVGTRATIGIMAGLLAVSGVAWALTRGGDDRKRSFDDDDYESDDDDDDDDGDSFLFGKSDNSADRAIRTMDRIATRICACSDSRCVEQEMKEMSKLKEPGKPTKAQMEKAMKIAERMADCQKRIMMSDVPPPPPEDDSDESDEY